jgi:hypothetical protein
MITTAGGREFKRRHGQRRVPLAAASALFETRAAPHRFRQPVPARTQPFNAAAAPTCPARPRMRGVTFAS